MTKKKTESATPHVDENDPGAAAAGLPGPADGGSAEPVVLTGDDEGEVVPEVAPEDTHAPAPEDAPAGGTPDDQPPTEDAPTSVPAPESAPTPEAVPEPDPVAAQVETGPASARVQRANS